MIVPAAVRRGSRFFSNPARICTSLAGMRANRPIFVVGSPRSGTSILISFPGAPGRIPISSSRRALFLDEPFEPNCLEPLRQRITSSDVPSDPRTDPAVIHEGKRLSQEAMMNPTSFPPDPAIADNLERSFKERSKSLVNLRSDHARNLERIAKLQKKFDEVKTQRTARNWFSRANRSYL